MTPTECKRPGLMKLHEEENRELEAVRIGLSMRTFNASFPFLGSYFFHHPFFADRYLLNIDLDVKILSKRWQFSMFGKKRRLWRKSSTRLLLAQSCQRRLVSRNFTHLARNGCQRIKVLSLPALPMDPRKVAFFSAEMAKKSKKMRINDLNQRPLWHVFLQICLWQASDETKRILRLNYHRCSPGAAARTSMNHSISTFCFNKKIMDFRILTGWLVNLLCISSIDQSEVLSFSVIGSLRLQNLDVWLRSAMDMDLGED